MAGKKESVSVAGFIVYDVINNLNAHYSYFTPEKRIEKWYVIGDEFGKLEVCFSKKSDVPITINFENHSKYIIIDGWNVDVSPEIFIKLFLMISDFDNISIIDAIRCLLYFSSISYDDVRDVAKINIIDKFTGNKEECLIKDFGRKLLMNDGREITISVSPYNGSRKFSCKFGDNEVSVLLKKGIEIGNDVELSDGGDYNIPFVYNIINYFNSLEFPVNVEDVYNKFLSFSFSKIYLNLSVMAISIFNKNIGFIIEMNNGKCIMTHCVTEKNVSEWGKDGNFKYKNKDTGAMVVIDKDSNTFYNGPVNCGLVDSKVFDLNELDFYRTILEAQDGLDEIRNLSNDVLARLKVR